MATLNNIDFRKLSLLVAGYPINVQTLMSVLDASEADIHEWLNVPINAPLVKKERLLKKIQQNGTPLTPHDYINLAKINGVTFLSLSRASQDQDLRRFRFLISSNYNEIKKIFFF